MTQERPTIHLAPHFHFDPVWIEDQRTYTRRAFELVRQLLAACRTDEGYHIILSELDYLKPFLSAYGEDREFVRDLAAAGRLETGGSYGQPNEMSIQGEALLRNLLHGGLYHEGMLGVQPAVYMPLDVFGHCLQLPQIVAKAGFEAIVWSKDISGVPPLCYLLAPDGTTLLQKHEPYTYQPESLEALLNTVSNGLTHQTALGLRHDLRLLGGDMTPPPPWLTGKSGKLSARDPAVLISTPQRYLTAVKPEARIRRAMIPLLGRDFSWYHAGTIVSRAELKIANRLAENRLLAAEKWATLAGLLGARYPDAGLDKAWRQVLFGQHHDAITGSCSDIPFLDLLAGYRESLDLASEIEERALDYIAGRIGTRSGRRAPRDGSALVVFNSLGWQRTDVCRARIELRGSLSAGFRLTDDDGDEVPCQLVAGSQDGGARWVEIVFLATDIPSVGYRTYYLRPARETPEAATAAESDASTIENDNYSIKADPSAGGALASIYDKSIGRELLNPEVGLGNELIALAEKPDRDMAPWELFTTGESVRSGEVPAEMSIVEGPIFSRLRTTCDLPDRGRLTQEVTIYSGLPRIDLRTTLENYHGLHELLALTFPLALPAGAPTFEDRFVSVLRKASHGRLDFRTLEGQNYSHTGLSATQNWVDVGPAPSLSVLGDDNRQRVVPLGPCALITSSDLKDRVALAPLQRALLRRGVTCTPWVDTDDPDTDSAACAFRLSLGADNAYSQRLLEATPRAAPRLRKSLPGRPWAGVLVSVPDPSGEGPDVPVLIADASERQGISQLVALLVEAIDADRLEIPQGCDFSGLAKPADHYGLALINRGTLGASLENDHTLAGLLFHTASWSTYPWGEGKLDKFLVPEHKSHVFEHALLPHVGDWRSGGVVQAGYEVNNPLSALQLPVQEGPLSPVFSLVSTDCPNAIITAVKPIGNPLSELQTTRRSAPEKGVLVRLYECEGRTETCELTFGRKAEEAWVTDLHERKIADAEITGGRWGKPAKISVEVPACGILTLGCRLESLPEPSEPNELGPVEEPHNRIHCRYWDHNLGAAPMGNQPVTLWLRGELPIGKTTRFSLGLSNDSRDREIVGKVDVIAPADWQLIPRQVPYRIPAASHAIYEIMVIVPPDASPCFLRAVTQEGDKLLQDTLFIGDIAPLKASLLRTPDGFVVRLRNPNRDYVEGQVALITPLESWGSAVGSLARSAITPRLHSFSVEAGEEKRFTFSAHGDKDGLWAVAKVMWYGQVQYVQESA